MRGMHIVCTSRSAQRLEGWHVISIILRVIISLLRIIASEGVIEISKDILEGSANVEAMAKGPTAGIVIIVVVVVVVHGDGGG